MLPSVLLLCVAALYRVHTPRRAVQMTMQQPGFELGDERCQFVGFWRLQSGCATPFAAGAGHAPQGLDLVESIATVLRLRAHGGKGFFRFRVGSRGHAGIGPVAQQ